MQFVGYHSISLIFYLHISIEIQHQVRKHFIFNHFSHCFVLVHSLRSENENDLLKYLPFRFLICMISAITNPFLYSYFNETFKEALEKVFLSCSPQIHRRIFHQTISNHSEKTTQQTFDKKPTRNCEENFLPQTTNRMNNN